MSPEVNPNLIVVEMNEWGIGKDNSVIATYGLGPCVGIIVYNHALKEALVGHWMDPSGIEDHISLRIGEFISGAEMSGFKAYLGGGGPTELTAEYIALMHRDRNAAMRALKANGLMDGQISVNWLVDGFQTGYMEINTSTGEVKNITEDSFDGENPEDTHF